MLKKAILMNGEDKVKHDVNSEVIVLKLGEERAKEKGIL